MSKSGTDEESVENALLVLDHISKRYENLRTTNLGFRQTAGGTLAASGAVLTLITSSQENMNEYFLTVALILLTIHGTLVYFVWRPQIVPVPIKSTVTYEELWDDWIDKKPDYCIASLTQSYIDSLKGERTENVRLAPKVEYCLILAVAVGLIAGISCLV